MVLIHQNFISLALLIATLLVAGFFAYIYSIKRQSYLLIWTAGWTVFGLHYLGPTLRPWLRETAFEHAMNHWLYALSGVLFFLGAQLYSRQKPWKIPGYAAAGVLAIWSGVNAFVPGTPTILIPASLLYIGVAVVFWQESRRQETLADRLLGVSFASWGVLWLALHYLQATPETQGEGIRVVAAAPCAFVAMLMVMALYEEEKRRIERNMLALSNLNLATSGLMGGEIQRMLSQALDRVLGVVRLPAGALFLHHGDTQGPTSVVAVGLSDEFCRATQNEGLDDYLVGLVARLGGLLGFRDLRDDSLSALEKEQSIRRFRELALAQGLRSVVAISLQAKEQAFGVLLLGTPDSRRFTPAELRLLLALGHQIGMAVENSYLIQQTSRRSEELHVLN
ncbi:MAG TPA: GAF domain-containing protein, partial [Candidatus Acidoferrum sp.]|nr:GAF domain-containing protein [Candidatus Acidoferrum sp.]